MPRPVEEFRTILVELYGQGHIRHPSDIPADRRTGITRVECEQLAACLSRCLRHLDMRITTDDEFGARWLIELALEFRSYHFIDLAGISVSQLAPVAAIGYGRLEIFEGDVPPFAFEQVRAYSERYHQVGLPEEYHDRARTIEEMLRKEWHLEVIDWPTLHQQVPGFVVESPLISHNGPPTLFELLFTTA